MDNKSNLKLESSAKRFNKQVTNFLNDLHKILPSQKDIAVYQTQLETVKMMNSQLLLQSFIQFVYPYKKQIMEKDEQFFLKDGNVQVEEDDLSKAIHLRDLWQNKLRKENKDIVWKYFQVMVVLAEKAVLETSGNNLKNYDALKY
jgi:hypothetical protein